MGKSNSVGQFAGKIRAAGKAIEKDRKRQLDLLAKKMEHAFTRAVAADLGGDNMFSGWKNAPLVPKSTVTVDSIKFEPAPKSLGPTRVAQQGRHQGNARGFSGPGIGVSSGVTSFTKAGNVRKVKARKGKRWNGTTKPKNTWSDATDDITKFIPKDLKSGFIKAAEEIFK